jgi:hypothetical protein
MTVHRFNFTVRTAAPTGLSSTATTSSSVSLSWNTVQYATGYRLYRGGVLVASPTGTTATDSGLAASTSYSYRVAAVSAGGESVQSATVNVTTAPIVAGGTATITWTAPTTNDAGQSFDNSTNDRTLAGYRIYYGTSEASVEAKTSAYVTDTASPYQFTGLATGTWYFLVVAVDGDGDMSANSDSISKVIP